MPTVSAINKCRTKAEGCRNHVQNQTSKNLRLKRTKCIGRIDYEEEDGETSTLPDGSSQVHFERFVDVLVV
jgi:hypothetical protein